MKFWIDFFLDRRFSFDFKIANFIMRDSLRNYLVVDAHRLRGIKEQNALPKQIERQIDVVIKDIDMLMKNIATKG